MSGPYEIVALDADYFDLSVEQADLRRIALVEMRRKLTDSELLASGLHKVEVRDRNGDCIADAFVGAA